MENNYRRIGKNGIVEFNLSPSLDKSDINYVDNDGGQIGPIFRDVTTNKIVISHNGGTLDGNNITIDPLNAGTIYSYLIDDDTNPQI